ncbi:hypothetical protein MASR2M48_28380 [Spirochaetota bacterium]
MKHRLYWLVLVLPLFLVSCLGIDADTNIAADGIVNSTIVYTVSSAVAELGKLGANASYLPLPVAQADLGLAARRAGGELRSWSRKEGSDSFVVTAALRFPSVAAFASFLDPAGELARYEEANGRATLTMSLSDGVAPADKDILEFIQVAFSDYRIAITLTVPRTPIASQGVTVTGRSARFNMKAADVYAS